MTTLVACPTPILQFFDNQGNPAVGGSVLTQVGGVNYPTYQDVNGTTALPNPIPLNSRGEISTAAGTSAQLFLEPNTVYTFTLYDANGNQLNQGAYVDGVQVELTQQSLGEILWPQTAAELAAGVTPVSYWYQPYNAFRYMTTTQISDVIAGKLSQDVTAPLQNWLDASVGENGVLPSGQYLISSQLTFKGNGQLNGDARASVILVYEGTGPIAGGGSMLQIGQSGVFTSAFRIYNVQFKCTNILSTNTTTQLTLLNPLYFEVDSCVFGGGNATANALVGLAIIQDSTIYTPPIGNGVVRNIEAVVEPTSTAVPGSVAVKIVGNSSEAIVNVVLCGEGAIEHFNVGVLLENCQGCVLTNWEFRGSAGSQDTGDTCIKLVNSQSNTIIGAALAPAPTVGYGITLDSNSTYNCVINPSWNLTSGNPISCYSDSGTANSLIGPGNAGGSFQPIAQMVGPISITKGDGIASSLAIPRTTSDTTESGLSMTNGGRTLTAPAWFGIASGNSLGSQDLQRFEIGGGLADRMDANGQRYIKTPNVDPGSANLADSQTYVWINEGTNALTFVVKYSTGTVKTGTLSVT